MTVIACGTVPLIYAARFNLSFESLMNFDLEICPLCGVGRLVEHTHERRNKIDVYKFVVRGLLHSVCTDCGERVTTPEQMCHNKRVLIDARAQAVAERNRLRRLTPTG